MRHNADYQYHSIMSSDDDASGNLDQDYGSIHSPNEGALVRKPKGWGTRHIFALLSFFGFANVYAMRVNLSVAIVQMVAHHKNGTHSDIGTECPNLNINVSSSQNITYSKDPQFDWDSKEQGIILGAFFYGYILTQIPGGFLAEKYGGKWFFGLGTFCTAVLTLATPLAASMGTTVFIIVRVLEGFAEGVTFPTMHAMIARWVPSPERNSLSTFIWSGATMGIVISMPASGYIASTYGWSSVFYIFGSLGVFWFIFWVLLAFDTPETHPWITPEEKRYIQSSIEVDPNRQVRFPPIKSLLTSAPFYAILVAHIGQNWGNYTIMTEMPTYLASIQHMTLKQNGFYSALPYLLLVMFSFPMSSLSDHLITKRLMSTGAVRKLMNSISSFGAALGLFALGFIGCNSKFAISALCFCVAVTGSAYSGFQVNHVDIAPNYAGTMMGITNMFANICGFAAPYAVGVIIDHQPTLAAWSKIFFISSGTYVATNIFYIIFASGKVAKWNYGVVE